MKRTIFIGQAMPKVKRDPHDWPPLNKWLYSIGVNEKQIEKHFLYTALVDYFPGSKNGSHIVPTEDEIKKEKDRLKKTIIKFDPEIIVPVGKLSITYCIGRNTGLLKHYVGNKYVADPYSLLGKRKIIIPLPHPSGVSTWKHKPENKKLLNKALDMIRNELFNTCS